MITIEAFDPSCEAPVLEHGENVFHAALAGGAARYHVHNPAAQDYDLVYKKNMECLRPILPPYAGEIIPDFKNYDENDASLLDLDTLTFFDRWVAVNANEYSIAIAKVLLQFTDREVYFLDPRAAWFLAPHERLHIGAMPQQMQGTGMLVGALGVGFIMGVTVDSSSKLSDIFIFHSLFFRQHMFWGKDVSRVKYIALPFGTTLGGIGMLLSVGVHAGVYVRSLGMEPASKSDTFGRFHVDALGKYYKMDFRRADSTEENTIEVKSFGSLTTMKAYNDIGNIITDDILQDKFRADLAEYEEAVLGGHNVLGVLIRGTDYHTSGLNADGSSRRQVSAAQMLPTIKAWMEKFGYDRVFLATEDKDILNEVRAALGSAVIAVAQERHSVNEFEQGELIKDLEKKIYAAEEYEDRVMETTVNYFYALHILSNCRAFLCSGNNNGYDTVMTMNNGRFERSFRFGFNDAGEMIMPNA